MMGEGTGIDVTDDRRHRRLQRDFPSMDSFGHMEVISRTTHTQHTINMINTMNHGGGHHTMAAIMPHPRL